MHQLVYNSCRFADRDCCYAVTLTLLTMLTTIVRCKTGNSRLVVVYHLMHPLLCTVHGEAQVLEVLLVVEEPCMTGATLLVALVAALVEHM